MTMARCGPPLLLLLLSLVISGHQLASSQGKDGQVKEVLLSKYDRQVPSLPYADDDEREVQTRYNRAAVSQPTRRYKRMPGKKPSPFEKKHVLVLSSAPSSGDLKQQVETKFQKVLPMYGGTTHASTVLIFKSKAEQNDFTGDTTKVYTENNAVDKKPFVTENKYLFAQFSNNGNGKYDQTYFRGKFEFACVNRKVIHGLMPKTDTKREVTTPFVEGELRKKQGDEYLNDLNKDLGDVICDTFSDELKTAKSLMNDIVTEAKRQAKAKGNSNDPKVIALDNKFIIQHSKEENKQSKMPVRGCFSPQSGNRKKRHAGTSRNTRSVRSSSSQGSTKCIRRKRDTGMIGRYMDDIAKKHMGLGKNDTAHENNNSLPADEAASGDEDEEQPENSPGSEEEDEEEEDDEDEDELSEEVEEEERK